jgi:hypothetical protein
LEILCYPWVQAIAYPGSLIQILKSERFVIRREELTGDSFHEASAFQMHPRNLPVIRMLETKTRKV